MNFFRFPESIPTIFYTIIWICLLAAISLGTPYYFTDDLKNDKELMSLLTKEGVLVTKNKSYAEVRALKYISNFFKIFCI